MEENTDPLNKKVVNALIVGNNPSRLSGIYEAMKPMNGLRYVAEILFDVNHVQSVVKKFKPDILFIHEAIDPPDFDKFIHLLRNKSSLSKIPRTFIRDTYEPRKIPKVFDEIVLMENLNPNFLSLLIKKTFKDSENREKMKQSITGQRKKRVSPVGK